MQVITYGSVCSGIEAASVAWHPLGFAPTWFAEIEPFPSAVLAHRFPTVANLGDMTRLADKVLAGIAHAPTVLVGGTPCQAFSVAGMRAGLSDPRGELTIKYAELLDAIDHVRLRTNRQPAVAVWENVPGVLSSKDNAFGCFLGALAGEDDALEPPGGKWKDAGCVYGPKRAIAWRVLDAQYFGLAQRRRRVFVVASARDGFDPAAVLFEREGVRRDTAPRRGARQDAAGTAARSVALRGRDGGATAELGDDAAGCLRASSGGGDKPHVLTVHGTQDPCVQDNMAFALGRNNDGENAVLAFQPGNLSRGAGSAPSYEVFPTLKADHGRGMSDQDPHVMSGFAVRRLTPVETERLQGFPDNWTMIPWRGKPADQCPDGPRYKAIGNSKAVPVVRWIGVRLKAALLPEISS